METVHCFEIDTFSKVLKVVQNQGVEVLLDNKLVIQKGTKATELVFENFALECVNDTNDRLIVVDNTHAIPTFTVSKIDGNIQFSAYASRLDTEQDIQQRKDTWCMLITKVLQE
jgi:hypothetical protein